MFNVCHAKFSQDENLKKMLKDTKELKLCEASRDKIWGIGLPLNDKDVKDEQSWIGKNILGKALERVRNSI